MNARKGAIADVLNLILAVWLFLSPWIVGFASSNSATNAWISAILIGIVAVAALAAFAEWEEWLNLVLGLWVLVSPWVIAFSAETAATQVHVWTGLAIAVIAAVEIWLLHRQPPELTAGTRHG
ncbi:MAG TPA: SPW repeat protein [Xanthobacteraceae bacterium]|nr:SPW repeat protein [Xanthobacteraceae bacterium]